MADKLLPAVLDFEGPFPNLSRRLRLGVVGGGRIAGMQATRTPSEGTYCNSKYISIVKAPEYSSGKRDYLLFVRCGTNHCLVDDGVERLFDIALNPFKTPSREILDSSEYVISGGINKFKAAYQFLNADLICQYKGFLFFDDDLDASNFSINSLLQYCTENKLSLCQPSIRKDSHFNHEQLLNKPGSEWRKVDIVEVMCPYFSRSALSILIKTFDMSYSTWGLDIVWPQILGADPLVIDKFEVRHMRPTGGEYYQYMSDIGIDPFRELETLSSMNIAELKAGLGSTRP